MLAGSRAALLALAVVSAFLWPVANSRSANASISCLPGLNRLIRKYGVAIARGQIAKTPHAEHLLTHTPEGRAILEKLMNLQGLDSPEKATYAYRLFRTRATSTDSDPLARSVLDRLKIADREIKRIRAINNVDPKQPLDWWERAQLEEFAATHLKTDSSKTLAFAPVPEARGHIFSETPTIPEPPAHLKGEAAAEWRVKKYFDTMGNCLKSMSAGAKKKELMTLIMSQLAVSEPMTVAGFVSGAIHDGKVHLDEIDWVNLPVNVISTAIKSVVENQLGLGKGSMLFRYVKLSTFGTTMGGIEGGIFYFSPISETHGHDKGDIALARVESSAQWSVGSAAAKLTLMNLLVGLRCMHPNAAMVAGNTGAQWLYRGASSWGYFYFQNNYLEKKGLGRKPSEEQHR